MNDQKGSSNPSKGIEKLTTALSKLNDERYEEMNQDFDKAAYYIFSFGFERKMKELLEENKAASGSFTKALKTVERELDPKYNQKVQKVKPHKFSKEFEQSMRTLLQENSPSDKTGSKIVPFPGCSHAISKDMNVKAKPIWAGKESEKKKKCFSLAAIASIFIMVLIGTNTQGYADRIPLVELVTEQYADYIGVTVNINDGPPIDLSMSEYEIYEPSWIPKGYTVGERDLSNFYYVEYTAKDKGFLYYVQYFNIDLPSRFDINSYSNKISIDGVAYYYNLGKMNNLMWIDPNTKTTYILKGNEKIQILIKIAQKIQKIS